MDERMRQLISKEMEQFYRSILLGELRDRINKLRSMGVDEGELEAAMKDRVVLPKLIVTKDFQILIGQDKRIIHMEPIVKAIYLLFLSHPEGIYIKCLPDYRKELTMLYKQLRPAGLTDRGLSSIEDVTNPTLNSINEKCTRIRKIFEDVLPKGISHYYSISGKRGERKMIALPRMNVTIECNLPNPQGL